MTNYLLKRLLLFVPALLLVSLLVFALSKAVPGDPAERDAFSMDGTTFNEQAYQRTAKQLGLDKPAFYFSLSSLAFPDSLQRILRKSSRNNLYQLINRHGNWPEIQQYFHGLLSLDQAIQNTPDSLRNDDYIEVRRIAAQLLIQHKDDEIKRLFNVLSEDSSNTNSILSRHISSADAAYSNVLDNESLWRLYVPDIKWWGIDNQYHNWISQFFQGNFGYSYDDGRPISRKISEALYWTLIMNICSLFIIFGISIPLGIFLASKNGKRVDRYVSILLFALFSLPVFWVATLLLVFFTTAEYGQWMDIFAGPGLGELRKSAPFWDRFWERGSHLILPIFCLSFAGTAYVTRQIRGTMIEVLGQDFVRTARAKGLGERAVLWKHAFRNALFPLISLIAMTIPGLLAGSIVVEFIFAVPGMGRLMFNSIFAQDWPFVYTVLLLTALLTMVANLLGDICYALADPRVRF
ncbi:MAG: peptide/nickel transport system permease protein [Polaribacter sp.]|jgi:peptide/nickel transport system permease protein